MAYLDQFLSVIVKHGGSDLHFAERQPPKMRVHGDIMPIRAEPISREEAVQMMSELCGTRNWETFEQRGDLDFAYEMDEASRFRSNYFKQSNGYGATFRLIPTKIATLEELGIPLIVREFANLRGGLVLVTGPTGSGKTTTCAKTPILCWWEKCATSRPFHLPLPLPRRGFSYSARCTQTMRVKPSTEWWTFFPPTVNPRLVPCSRTHCAAWLRNCS